MELLLERWVSPEERLIEKLSKNAHQLVVHQRDTLETGIFESLDLLLDNHLERRGPHEQCRRGSRGIVEDSPDIDVLNLVKRIHRFDPIRVELMEHKADARSSGKLHTRQFLIIPVEHGPPLVTEFRDKVEDDRRTVAEHRVAERIELGSVFLEGCRYPRFDVG